MGVLSENAIIGASAAGGYDIDYSCRWNSGSNGGLLSRTQTTPTGNKAFTYSFWWKGKTDIGGLTGNFDWDFLDCVSTDNDIISLGRNDPRLYFALRGNTGNGGLLVSTAKFRDPSAWYHWVIAVDTSQSTASNRMRFYSNGEEVTAFDTANYCAQDYVLENFNTNGTSVRIGNQDGSYPGGCMMSEVHFIDGQQLTPASFGETDPLTNQWKAKKYAGTYGNNGFFLEFKNSAALGADTSGNGNNWTVSNLAATDQMIDTPQNSTGGNFATLNPLIKPRVGTTTYKEGNLKVQNDNWDAVFGTQRRNSGKWYWEVVGVGATISNGYKVGIFDADGDSHSNNIHDAAGAMSYQINGTKTIASTNTSYGASYTNGDIIGIAVDMDNSTIQWYKNNAAQGSVAFSGGMQNASGFVPMTSMAKGPNDCYAYYNFGQDSSFGGNKTAQGNTDGNNKGDFYYTPPSGFLALCTDNLPDPSIALPGEHFNTKIYTGSGSARSITGVGFQPDWLWIKRRSGGTQSHHVVDSVRGVSNAMASDLINADFASSVSSLDSDGFSLDSGAQAVNGNTETYVAWNWKAGGTAVSNTDGDITTSVSANTTAGFSIGTFTGNGTHNQTIGHGLSVAPDLVIIKSRDNTNEWTTGWGAGGYDWTDYLYLNQPAAAVDDLNFWRDTYPTASLITLGSNASVNQNTIDYVFYAFHGVEGYSKIGVYQGNGSNDGNFLYTGFSPAYVLFKDLGSVGGTNHWAVLDNKRITYNLNDYVLRPSSNAAVYHYNSGIDFVSNGIKIRSNNGMWNDADSYLYLAFAESPFKTANAR